MSNTNETESKKTLSLSGRGRLELRKSKEAGQVRQSFPHGRSKSVTVEVVKRKRKTASAGPPGTGSGGGRGGADPSTGLTQEERQKRSLALRGAKQEEENLRRRVEEEAQKRAEEDEARRKAEAEAEEARRVAEESKRRAEAEAEEKRRRTEGAQARPEQPRSADARGRPATPGSRGPADAAAPPADSTSRRPRPAAATAPTAEEDEAARNRRGKPEPKRPSLTATRRQEPRRRSGKITVTQAFDDSERTRSLASVRRQRERERRQAQAAGERAPKQVRDVVVPETITVQELANRMAERAGDVIKSLMKMGVMATINQPIDTDTAEVVVNEFGHRIRRVAESDVEIGLKGEADRDEDKHKRPPVVTIMGHVDHGKTSLLDALRETDVAGREAGGITQHIGAYQIALSGGERITFLDTPGHEAFTQMRARGATVTDIVVLVVAADDGIMAQTVEAIRHAQAADVPIIVAINKMDRPDANPERVRQELLQHGMVDESLGGDVLSVEVSAKERTGLDKLEEAILLQAELLELTANPDRPAEGTVVEAKLERGRGAVATVLVERGTLRVGDVFVAGSEWGRVRALIDDRGQQVETAGPSAPVEVLGLNGSPNAGEDVAVVENESRAREVTEYRQRRDRDARTSLLGPTSITDFFKAKMDGVAKEFPVVVKADVQGSAEAIITSLDKLQTDEVKAQILHGAVGGINESDVTLAQASGALIIGFNVRANPQARDLARREGVEIRYYSVIYNVVDDIKQILSGMLAPEQREKIIGNAQIRKVFAMSRAGKVAGCMITDGLVKRGAGVRLLRDNVVIHEGKLKTLKRFKDEVAEVREGYECGMAFENYQDLQEGDVIECYEVEEVQRTL